MAKLFGKTTGALTRLSSRDQAVYKRIQKRRMKKKDYGRFGFDVK